MADALDLGSSGNFPVEVRLLSSTQDLIVQSIGRLAQLVRASGLHPEGRGFDSYSGHKKII